MPTPKPISRPRRRHSPCSPATASRIATAIAAARSAASGHGSGSLKNTMMPSPEKWSSVPSDCITKGPSAVILAQQVEHLLGLGRLGEGGEAAHIAEHDDDVAAVA